MPHTITNLTDEQASALSAHDRSVSLAAGAGCGKTFVLTQRFLSYLDPRQLGPTAELHELVAITFTDAAAREMRERIRQRCYQRLDEATDSQEQQAWRRLLRAIDGARISTIHAFCAALLRTHAAEAGVDPRFEQLEPPAAELLRLQTLDDRLRQLLLAGDQTLLQLATRFRLHTLRDHLARLLSGNVQDVVAQWANKDATELVSRWKQFYDESVVPLAREQLRASDVLQQLEAIADPRLAATDRLRAHLTELKAVLREVLYGDQLPLPLEELNALARVQRPDRTRICSKKDWLQPDNHSAYKKTCETVRKLLEKHILRRPLADKPLLETAAVGLDLLHLVADVSRCYEQAKQERNVLEFDDLLIRCADLLRHPAIRQSIVGRSKLLMVDEFQDTDPVQVAIVKAFCGDDWPQQGLFVVGDFKQSIYRFRGAEPRVSSELRAMLPRESRLSLTTNFRSQPAVLDFVNALFGNAFGEEYEPLRPHRPQTTPTPAVEFLWALEADSPAKDQPSHGRKTKKRDIASEARYIARRLAQLIEGGEPLVVDASDKTAKPPRARPLRLGDIAILFRSLSDVAIYEEALREHGLDYYLAGGHAFYAQQEIYDILHLLSAVASPADELSLAGALRSPLFALEDETLYWLVQTYGSLNAGLDSESPPAPLTGDQQEKVARAAATIRHLRARKDRLLVAELLSEALERTGYDAALLCEFLGQRKLANVHKLLEQARALDRVSPGDLHGFITQLSEFVVRAPKEPLATTQAEGDVIRLMTIHHAKGLEFPLVVLADLERSIPHGSNHPVLDPQLGPLVPMDASQQSAEKPVVGWDLYQYVEKQQDAAERMRLFYVACTRAADYLILSSSIADIEKPKSDWLRLLNQRFDLQTGRCRADLPAGFAAPQVLVTTTEPELNRRDAGKPRGPNLSKLVAKTRQLVAQDQGVVPEAAAPIPVDANGRQRFSFSRLTGGLARIEPAIAAQTIAEPTPLDPRGLGTLVHSVLEQIDFTAPSAANDVPTLCQHLAPLHFQSDWQTAAAAAAEMVQRFLRSDRAARLAEATIVRREVEFVLPWPLQHDRQQGRYLHGYIDCLYQDPAGNWHLVDYKSNQVTAAGVPQAAQHYALQLFVYSLACQSALGTAPAECVLHFLKPGVEFEMAWDAEQRQAMAAQVEQAIETLSAPS